MTIILSHYMTQLAIFVNGMMNVLWGAHSASVHLTLFNLTTLFLTKTLPGDLLPFNSLLHFGLISKPDFVLLLHSSNFLYFLNFGVLLIIICCTLGNGDGA